MAEMTPMMRQYLQIKEEHKDHILMFRLGDFYEMFFDDAKIASQELELVLTGRDCGQEERAPMCGVPYHSCEGYIARLVSKGYKVAICEQTEDPAKATGLVRREVVRIITPGTVTDASMLDERKNNFIASLYLTDEKAACCFADVSTGQTYISELCGDNIASKIENELGRYCPSELLINEKIKSRPELVKFIKERISCTVEFYENSSYDLAKCAEMVERQYGPKRIENGIGSDELIFAVGRLLDYLKSTQKAELSNINTVELASADSFLELDFSARRNLELVETMRSKEKRGSLLWVLDKTKTSMGGRLIRKWIEAPLKNMREINGRLDSVEALFINAMNRGELIGILGSGIYDLERIGTRMVYGNTNCRDLVSLAQTSEAIPEIKKIISEIKCQKLDELCSQLDELSDMRELIRSSIVDEPPFSIREGHMIRDGYNETVDSLRYIRKNGKNILAQIEQREREETGIPKLKVGYNRVFGYYIEVTKSYIEKVPQRYIRKQTLANCERYITQELKDIENEVLGAQDKLCALEYEIFTEIREKIAAEVSRIQKSARIIAEVDVLCSFAEVSAANNYIRPEITASDKLEIEDGRHPVVERMLTSSLFVPNDTLLDCNNNRTAIITGPNMAGKSTYMRQCALIVIMAQSGCFVPAKKASVGIVDKIMTRVGASDDLSQGQSTFMVEMNEVAQIVKNATKDSLIILDEIGRGTSTFDGMSIARAVLEYINSNISAKTMFATHYHELTELEGICDGVINYNIAVKKRGDDITFLRKIIRGGADDSYGIEVARLAGVPDEIIVRAKEILSDLESGSVRALAGYVKKDSQREQAKSGYEDIIGKLELLNVETLTPIEALNVLYELKKELLKDKEA